MYVPITYPIVIAFFKQVGLRSNDQWND